MDLPYAPRPGQVDMVAAITTTVTQGDALYLQSPTGTGKTVCALAGTLGHGRKVLYLTRTNSQHVQVIKELRHWPRQLGVPLQGRTNLCLLARDDPDLAQGSPEELSRFCSRQKRLVENGEAGCRYYATLGTHSDQDLITTIAGCTAEEWARKAATDGFCPYEGAKRIAHAADLVTMPYILFLLPELRNAVLDWLRCSLDDVIVVADEAHNLPDIARDLASIRLSVAGLDRAIDEAARYRIEFLAGETDAALFLETLTEAIGDLRQRYLQESDGLIPREALMDYLLEALGGSGRHLRDCIRALGEAGELVRRQREDQGKLPRSHLGATAAFLAAWEHLEEDHYLPLVLDDEALELFCLEPRRLTEVLVTVPVVFQSGTLRPFSSLQAELGVPGKTLAVPSPFPRENLLVRYSQVLTTRYATLQEDPKMLGDLRQTLRSLIKRVPRNTLILFPSYALRGHLLSEDLVGSQREMLLERQGAPGTELADLLARFAAARDAVLMAVMGGRIAEGLDFPAGELELVIIVGIPYPKPSARLDGLVRYLDVHHGQGWEHAVAGPTARKVVQGVGRLIRGPDDRGAAVILDLRASRFTEYFLDLRASPDPVREVVRFFKRLDPDNATGADDPQPAPVLPGVASGQPGVVMPQPGDGDDFKRANRR